MCQYPGGVATYKEIFTVYFPVQFIDKKIVNYTTFISNLSKSMGIELQTFKQKLSLTHWVSRLGAREHFEHNTGNMLHDKSAAVAVS